MAAVNVVSETVPRDAIFPGSFYQTPSQTQQTLCIFSVMTKIAVCILTKNFKLYITNCRIQQCCFYSFGKTVNKSKYLF